MFLFLYFLRDLLPPVCKSGWLLAVSLIALSNSSSSTLGLQIASFIPLILFTTSLISLISFLISNIWSELVCGSNSSVAFASFSLYSVCCFWNSSTLLCAWFCSFLASVCVRIAFDNLFFNLSKKVPSALSSSVAENVLDTTVDSVLFPATPALLLFAPASSALLLFAKYWNSQFNNFVPSFKDSLTCCLSPLDI